MSWGVTFIGTPDKVCAALEANSAALTGQSKAEFDDALPHLVGLVKQNRMGDGMALVQLEANGSGYTKDGVEQSRNLAVKLTPVYGKILI